MSFGNVGPQWDREEPWQAQEAKIVVRGMTDSSPWMRHQRNVFFGALAALALVTVAVIAISVAMG